MLHAVDAHDFAVHSLAERSPCLVGAARAAGTQRDDGTDLAVAASGEQTGVARRVHGMRDGVEHGRFAALTRQRVCPRRLITDTHRHREVPRCLSQPQCVCASSDLALVAHPVAEYLVDEPALRLLMQTGPVTFDHPVHRERDRCPFEHLGRSPGVGGGARDDQPPPFLAAGSHRRHQPAVLAVRPATHAANVVPSRQAVRLLCRGPVLPQVPDGQGPPAPPARRACALRPRRSRWPIRASCSGR